MTFNTIESSNDLGRPIFLYAFHLGSATWRYTSSDEDMIMGGYTWSATAISDDGVKLSGEAQTDSLNITAPSRIAPVQMFISTPPSQPIIVNIFHCHEGDSEAVLAYMGELLQVGQPEPGKATLTCDAISASMQRDGLRLGWQRTCPYALYDELTCKADKTAHGRVCKVFDVSGNSVTFQGIDDLADDVLAGGFIEWVHPVRGKEYRGIETQKGSVIGMFGLADDLYYGLEVTAYPGCDRKASTCATKFNNLDNYGGVPDMPGKSPFDGNPVF
jgi:uncharacterized phage protein (TIGR02218 family)